MLAGEPSGAAAMGDDVRDWFAVDGQRNSLTRLDRGDHLTGPVAEVSNPDLYVRQCSTDSVKFGFLEAEGNLLGAIPPRTDRGKPRWRKTRR